MRQPASLRQSQRRSPAAKPSSEIYSIRLSQSTDNAKIATLYQRPNPLAGVFTRLANALTNAL
jgi:hypothetical protein